MYEAWWHWIHQKHPKKSGRWQKRRIKIKTDATPFDPLYVEYSEKRNLFSGIFARH